MPYKKLHGLLGRNNPCLNCPPITPRLKLNRRLGVGFGDCHVSVDAKEVWREKYDDEWEDLPTLMRFERMAQRRKKGDWRVVLNSPLHGETYQRQGKNLWVLVESNRGFA